LALCAAACSGNDAHPNGPPGPTAAAPPPTAAASTAAAQPTTTTAAAASTSADKPPIEASRCGQLDCWRFDTADQAFAYVLETSPAILAIGESHARRGMEKIPSTTKRFTEQLLPKLPARTTDLILELWMADGACGKQEQVVAKQQKQVTKNQAKSNTNEFVVLGHAAKARGMIPHVLRPSCDEYKHIAGAGPDAPLEMLTMITRLTARKAKQLMEHRRNPKVGKPPFADPLLVAYGGGMHNDLRPQANREKWSFGPELHQAVDGRYVELDLIVPEFIRSEPPWTALPWYDHFDQKAAPDKTTLLRQSPGSYVLIFPRGS
jgi:hypothetical protein